MTASKVPPRPGVTPLNTHSLSPPPLGDSSSLDWWLRPRPVAIPPHLRSRSPSPSPTPPVPSRQDSKANPLLALFGSPLPAQDPYEEPFKDDDEPSPHPMSLPSSPAAMFLSGLYSPTGSVRANSMNLGSLGRPKVSPPPDEIIGGYKLGQVIGHGAFSIVKRATSVGEPGSPTTVAAVKIIRKDDSRPGADEARVRLENEAKLWAQLSHEHILPLFTTVDTPDATYLFTLLCPAGTLLDVINQHKADGLEGVGMDDAGMIFRQIVRGLKYLHEVVRLVHGDLKLENVLIDDQGSCRIADFGLARWMEDVSDEQDKPSLVPPAIASLAPESAIHLSLQRPRGRTSRNPSRLSLPHPDTVVEEDKSSGSGSHTPAKKKIEYYFPPGSLPYAAPELLVPIRADSIPPPNPAQDIWALGCVLYALLFGILPFTDPFEPRLQMKILRGVWKLPPAYRSSLPNKFTRRSRSGSRSRAPSHGRRERSSSRNRLRSPITPNFNSPINTRFRSASRGSPQAPKTIGRVAENVLHGTMCTSVQDRWTISMIDEVGWGVGWDLDVDEAGEEFADVEATAEMTTSGSESSNTSSNSEERQDRYGNRFYVPPSHKPSLETNKLFSSTLNLVTSPTGMHTTESQRSLLDVVEEVKIVSPTAAAHEEKEEDEIVVTRSRSRGKRGKHSRSSSRAANVTALTPSPPASNSASPAPPETVTVDPFQQFREGYIPPSVIPLLPSSSTGGSRPGSRAPSRPTSAVPSRATSRERDWPRGRPTANAPSSWRVTPSSTPATTSSGTQQLPNSMSCPLPRPWRGATRDTEFSTSPSVSPPPVTPSDSSRLKETQGRSHSRGRRVGIASSSSPAVTRGGKEEEEAEDRKSASPRREGRVTWHADAI